MRARRSETDRRVDERPDDHRRADTVRDCVQRGWIVDLRPEGQGLDCAACDEGPRHEDAVGDAVDEPTHPPGAEQRPAVDVERALIECLRDHLDHEEEVDELLSIKPHCGPLSG